jgi:hypothetical protein
MKKYIFVLLVFALLFSSTAIADTTDKIDYLYLASYEAVSFIPATINTGDIVSMAVDLKNRGTYIDITNITGELILDSGITSINSIQFIDEIKAGTTKKLVFEFKIDSNTLPGNYSSTLNLNYNRNDEKVFQQETIIIPVIKTEKKVDIVVSPSVISPGSKETLKFTIINLTNQPISNLSFIWEEENDLVLPLGSDNKRFISYIPAKERATIEYLVAADPNIITGIYPLTAKTTLQDNNGSITQESTLGLLVGGITDFDVSIDLSETLISVNIANIGANNAESVVIKLNAEGVQLTNNTEIIGNLDRGDYTIASFETTGLNAKEVKVEINYTDTTGERQVIDQIVSLNNQAKLDRTNIKTGTGRGIKPTQTLPLTELVILVVLGVVVIVAFKKREIIRIKIRNLRK